MPVLSARRLSKAFGPQTLFTDIALTITRGEKVGLLGINGAGKSTLLRVLAGAETADEGVIDRRRDATILYLEQEPQLDDAKSAREIVEEGLSAWKKATSRYDALSHQIDEQGPTDALLAEQAECAEQVDVLGGWERGHIVNDMLTKLGVRDTERPVGSMSGGERRRVALAHLLVAQPTLAILDEPTNHLDTSTIDWLEEYLSSEYEGAVLMVTHDRYVLDSVCDRTLELDRGTLHEYQGGYGDYLDQKAERLAHEDRAEQNRMNFVRREKVWLARGPKARSTKQKARIQRAEAVIAADPVRHAGRVELGGLDGGAGELGKSVLDLESVSLEIGGKMLVRDLTLHLVAGERVGIIGPNGAGKTSLLRAVTGELEAASGKVIVGTRTKIALFDQARAQLRDDWSILDNIAEREGAERTGAGVVKLGKDTIEVRSYLELFLFDPSKQRQKVGSLSGGERARVALAKILKDGANLLLLDEPTNDLDVATLSALEELLETWPGCVITVSHDRYFLDRVATCILAFEGDGKVERYAGGYSNYQAFKAAPPRSSTKPPAPSAPPPASLKAPSVPAPQLKPLSYAERLELGKIMEAIASAEAAVVVAEGAVNDPSLYAGKPDEARRAGKALEAAQAEVARLVARWENLESRKDAGKK